MGYDRERIEELFTYLGAIFSTNYETVKKKRVLFIFGESNTLKTTLIADLFIEFFGIENVALILQSKTFSFQDFNNKLVAILDEFKYYDSLHTEYLKIFEHIDTIDDKKFQDAVTINPLHIVILSNENFIDTQPNLDKQNALNNRIRMFTFFRNYLSETDYKLQEQIKKENILIVILLCRFYDEFVLKKSDKRKRKTRNLLITLLEKHEIKRLDS